MLVVEKIDLAIYFCAGHVLFSMNVPTYAIVNEIEDMAYPLFNISRNIDFQPGFLESGLTKMNFDNGFEFLRSFRWFAMVLVLALK